LVAVEETENGARESAVDDYNTVPDDLPSRTRQMVEALDPAAETLDLNVDTRA
jgi:hypothetical protein